MKEMTLKVDVDTKMLQLVMTAYQLGIETGQGKNNPTDINSSISWIISQNINEIIKVNDSTSEMDNIPHIRIELNDVREVPNIWIDGMKVIGPDATSNVLQHLKLDWSTNTEVENQKSFMLQTIDLEQNKQVTRYADNLSREQIKIKDTL
jgi:glutaredoxin